jgi:hypothetical protein
LISVVQQAKRKINVSGGWWVVGVLDKELGPALRGSAVRIYCHPENK